MVNLLIIWQTIASSPMLLAVDNFNPADVATRDEPVLEMPMGIPWNENRCANFMGMGIAFREWEGMKTAHFPICRRLWGLVKLLCSMQIVCHHHSSCPLDSACFDTVCAFLKFWLIFFHF